VSHQNVLNGLPDLGPQKEKIC